MLKFNAKSNTVFFKMFKAVGTKISRLCRCMVSKAECLSAQILSAAKKLVVSDLKIKISAIAACLCMAATGTVTAYGLTMIYGVSYNGKTIGYVQNKSDVDKAVKKVFELVMNDGVDKYVENVNCYPVVGGSQKISTTDSLCNRIINETDSIVKCVRMYVDGNFYLCAKSGEQISFAMQSRLAEFMTGTASEITEFFEKTEIVEGYCIKSDLLTKSELNKKISKLTVQNVKYETKTVETPYKTVKKETDEKAVGYNRVERNGSAGLVEKTEKVVFVNGVEKSREETNSVVLSEPVDEIIVVGTASQKPVSSNSNVFIWPLKRLGGEYISSYFGDGRGHKGWDICTKSGTPIYAARSGKVVRAGWDSSGYGYLVEIDHGNGLSTLYAHCSSILVKNGEIVPAGKTIATVGKTGRASGYHLHFEVHVKGTAVNPAKFF